MYYHLYTYICLHCFFLFAVFQCNCQWTFQYFMSCSIFFHIFIKVFKIIVNTLFMSFTFLSFLTEPIRKRLQPPTPRPPPRQPGSAATCARPGSGEAQMVTSLWQLGLETCFVHDFVHSDLILFTKFETFFWVDFHNFQKRIPVTWVLSQLDWAHGRSCSEGGSSFGSTWSPGDFLAPIVYGTVSILTNSWFESLLNIRFKFVSQPKNKTLHSFWLMTCGYKDLTQWPMVPGLPPNSA